MKHQYKAKNIFGDDLRSNNTKHKIVFGADKQLKILHLIKIICFDPPMGKSMDKKHKIFLGEFCNSSKPTVKKSEKRHR